MQSLEVHTIDDVIIKTKKKNGKYNNLAGKLEKRNFRGPPLIIACKFLDVSMTFVLFVSLCVYKGVCMGFVCPSVYVYVCV